MTTEQIKIKDLKNRKKKTLAALSAKKDLLEDTKNNINRLKKSVKNIENEIMCINNNAQEIMISEHAMLRYIERVMMIDMKALEEKILSKEERHKYKELGNMSIKKDGYELTVVNGTVVTVLVKAA